MVNENHTHLIDNIVEFYGDGSNGSCPTQHQWHWVLAQPDDRPLTLINFFKMRDVANYSGTAMTVEEAISGEEAFGRYAAISGPALERAGGHFLHVGPFGHSFIGENEDWDLVAIGHYPNSAALIALFEDNEYKEVFAHRTAACLKQKTLIS